jgi:hypothetical protein
MTPVLSTRLRSLICVKAFVLIQHGYYAKAAMWFDLLHCIGDRSEHVMFSRAVANFLNRDHSRALSCLNELDNIYPMERFGRSEAPAKYELRRYMRARARFELAH